MSNHQVIFTADAGEHGRAKGASAIARRSLLFPDEYKIHIGRLEEECDLGYYTLDELRHLSDVLREVITEIALTKEGGYIL